MASQAWSSLPCSSASASSSSSSSASPQLHTHGQAQAQALPNHIVNHNLQQQQPQLAQSAVISSQFSFGGGAAAAATATTTSSMESESSRLQPQPPPISSSMNVQTNSTITGQGKGSSFAMTLPPPPPPLHSPAANANANTILLASPGLNVNANTNNANANAFGISLPGVVLQKNSMPQPPAKVSATAAAAACAPMTPAAPSSSSTVSQFSYNTVSSHLQQNTSISDSESPKEAQSQSRTLPQAVSVNAVTAASSLSSSVSSSQSVAVPGSSSCSLEPANSSGEAAVVNPPASEAFSTQRWQLHQTVIVSGPPAISSTPVPPPPPSGTGLQSSGDTSAHVASVSPLQPIPPPVQYKQQQQQYAPPPGQHMVQQAPPPWMHPSVHRPPYGVYPHSGGYPTPYLAVPRSVGMSISPSPNPNAPTIVPVPARPIIGRGSPLPPGVSPPPSSQSNSMDASIRPTYPPSLQSTSSKSTSIVTNYQASNEKTKEDNLLKNVEADSWTAHKTEDGTVYYYNAISGESTYNKPPGFNTEPENITAQPTPVSWEKLSGTDWALVTTNDGKKYYYNTKNQATSWQVPAEVAELRKKKMQEAPTAMSTIPCQVLDKGSISSSVNLPAATSGGREAVGQKSSAALDLIKKKLQDSVIPIPTTTLANTGSIANSISGNGSSITEASGKVQQNQTGNEKIKASLNEGTVSDSSSDSEDEEVGPTKEECILQFKEMLKERGVAPFSKWEKELPKIIFDPRFKAIPSYTERRAIFEHYVRTRADEERREKRAAQKAAIEGFKQLLDEASGEITYKTDYESFAKKWGHDQRFEALDRKDRESLLNERVLPLRKSVEEKVKAIHAAGVASFKSMLREKGAINSNSRWSRVKEALRSDSRYKAVKREDREALFDEYIAEWRASEKEAERLAKAKREEEEKLKERKRETLKRKEREEQEMERARLKARRKDASSAYQALLTEKIRNPEASWTESLPKLEKDPLGRATNVDLESAERERLFREHVNGLYERCAREYRALLAEVITVDSARKHMDGGKDILGSWSEAKELLKSDQRYNRTPRRERQLWWRRYVEDVQRRLKLNGSERMDDRQHSFEASKSSPNLQGKEKPISRAARKEP